MNKKILRKEYFGGLFYDPRLCSLKVISKEDFDKLIASEKDLSVFKQSVQGYLSGPLKMFVAISSKCNLSCSHCLIGKNSGYDEIAFEDYPSIFEKIAKMGVLEVRLGGLEPTARIGFEKIFQEATNNGLTISINTNGVFSNEILEKLAGSTVDKVHVSLDGLRDNHDKIRSGGCFDKSLNTIKALKEKGKYVRIVTCIYKENIGDIEGLISLAEEIGCDIKFSPIANRGSAEHMGGILSKKECEDLKNYFKERKPSERINIFYSHGVYMDDFANYCDFYDFDSTVCGELRTQLRLENDGLLYVGGCMGLGNNPRPIGNTKSDFNKLWAESQIELMDNFIKKPICRVCDMGEVMKKWTSGPTTAFNFIKGAK